MPAAWFTDAEVAGYDAIDGVDDPQRIDDSTWRDLDAGALLRRMAASSSIYARQYLFRRLRRGASFGRGERPLSGCGR